jgi:uracil-DNA glycosylase
MKKIECDLSDNWQNLLQKEFKKEYFNNLTNFVEKEYSTTQCYPPKSQLFEAFNLCPFEKLKVVIIGQDPYHREGQAHGLCFSVNEGIDFPPSLKNIFREIEADLGKPIPHNGNLSRWAKQGVLLLNATLSVQAGKAGSHQGKGWEKFTDKIIHQISNEKKNVVFMLWGAHAQKKAKLIDETKHLYLTSGHPSPLSANRGYWFENKHFSQANKYLSKVGKVPIEW